MRVLGQEANPAVAWCVNSLATDAGLPRRARRRHCHFDHLTTTAPRRPSACAMETAMSKSITRPKLVDVVANAAASAIVQASQGEPVTVGKALAKAREIAADVVTDGRIAQALRPVAWYKSAAILGAELFFKRQASRLTADRVVPRARRPLDRGSGIPPSPDRNLLRRPA